MDFILRGQNWFDGTPEPALPPARHILRLSHTVKAEPMRLVVILSLFGTSCQVVQECDQGQECVDLNKCRDWCTRIEGMGGGISSLPLKVHKQFNKIICGYVGHAPKICCQENQTSRTDVCPIRKGSDPVSKCGIVNFSSTDQRVTFGEDANPGDWPWMARLLYQKNRHMSNTTFCSGTIVSSRHVVTAAHCVEDQELGEPTDVVLGELDITTEYDCLSTEDECSADGELGKKCLKEERCAEKSRKYTVLSTIVHEQYSADSETVGFRSLPVFDLAILTLAKPVTFSDFINPICLPDPAHQSGPDQPLRLTGWGNTVAGLQAPESAVILQVLTGLKEDKLDECRTLLSLPLKEHHMCVSTNNSARACNGDSGGPVSRLLGDPRVQETRVWHLAGVVSFGSSSTCGAKAPLVVTRVEDQDILNWIKTQVFMY